LRAWLCVVLYSILIFSTIPIARGIQRSVYNTFGKEAFTYIVLFAILAGLTILLYLFIFRLNIRRPSQYIWLLSCAGLYGYLTLRLRRHPEEAIHLLEYGLLGYLSFRALSRRIHDRTIYITSTLIVLFIGILDEFIQWMMPGRYWGFRDIGINVIGSAILMIALWKGIRPGIIQEDVSRHSIRFLQWMITIDLILLGLCLSNTPRAVDYYTNRLSPLLWLRDEEPMVEYGHRHIDPEVGTFYSRLEMERLLETDRLYGASYGREISEAINNGMTYGDLIRSYNPLTNPFLYEFIRHLDLRDEALKELEGSDNPRVVQKNSIIAFTENLILERYFSNTLRYSGLELAEGVINTLRTERPSGEEPYVSRTGGMITSFNPCGAWLVILITIISLWIGGGLYSRQLHG